MSQNSMAVANGTGAAVRSGLNNALHSLVTNNSGTGAPSTTYAYMLWADTTNDLLKIRNAADTAWITIGKLSQTNLGLSAIPRGHLWGMTVSNNGTDATNDLDIAAGACASDDATDANRVLLNPGALTKQIDAVWAAGNAAGGRISSESLVNGTWHVYAFRRSGGTDDICFSQSLTPTLPDSGTNKRRIGSILRESAAIVAFSQNGDEFLRKTAILDYNTTNPGTSAVLATLSVPTGVSVRALCRALARSTSATHGVILYSSPDETDQAPSTSAAPLASGPNYNVGNADWPQPLALRTNASGQIRFRLSFSDANVTVRIAPYGWIDTRGREN